MHYFSAIGKMKTFPERFQDTWELVLFLFSPSNPRLNFTISPTTPHFQMLIFDKSFRRVVMRQAITLIQPTVDVTINVHRDDGLGCNVPVIWYGIRQQQFVIGLKRYCHHLPVTEQKFSFLFLE